MEVRPYIYPLFKWWWLILASTLLAGVSSYFAVSQQPPTYRATTTLMIGRAFENPNPSNSDFALSQRLAATYADIAQRQPVQEQAKAALGIALLPDYVARPLPNSQLLEISVTDTSPERAQAVANELGNQLILQSPTAPRPEEREREEFINEQLTSLESKITATEDEITVKQGELENSFSALEIVNLNDELSVLQNKLGTLQANYAALLSNTESGAINTLAVIEPATLPKEPVGPNEMITVFAASAIGFVLAAGAAYILEYLADTVESPRDVSRLTGLALLPSIPEIDSNGNEYELITSADPRSPATDAFRRLRTGILAGSVDDPYQTLLITSAKPEEGKSRTAANLAVVMAQGGHDVVLIDADLRRPVQHTLFQLGSNKGLTDLLLALSLAGGDDEMGSLLDEFVQPTSVPRLDLLTSGPVSPNAFELLSSEKMKELLAILTGAYDMLIIDSPPLLAVSDGLVLSTQVDSVLLVSDFRNLQRTQLVQTVEQLRDVHARVIGLTLNRVDPKTEGYYQYRDYYDKPTDADQSVATDERRRSLNGHASDWLRKWLRRASAQQ